MKKIKAWALVDKRTNKLCRMSIHILATDNPYCIYESEEFLEGDKNTKIVPCEITLIPIKKKKV